MSTHTISVKLENKPGALARVSQLFSRRGYNIQSLAVGPTERPDISRLTLRVDCSEHSLALVTVSAAPAKRTDLIALAQVAGATVADIGRDAITFQVVGRPDEVD